VWVSESNFPPLLVTMIPGPVFEYHRRCSRLLRPLVIALLFLLALAMPALPAHAQTDDDVHIAPRSPVQKKSTSTEVAGGPNSTGVHQRPLLANVDLVLVPVTITDPMNRAVVGLDKNNFELYEDGQKQVIRDVTSEDGPLALGVIFDTSRSMSNKIETARQSVMQFFQTSNPKDDFFLVTFSDRPQLLVDFTTSLEDIQKRLIYALPEGHTSLLDAIYMGLTKIRHSRYTRRALLIISDGGDNRSRYTCSQIKRMVEESDVQLYGLGIFDSIFQTAEERSGRQLLDSVTQATGGRTFAIKDLHDLPEAAGRIALELRNRYVLAYRSGNSTRDGRWRKIKVNVVPPQGMPQLRVYAKSGYYSPEE
jgi:Ca-activated chloride channel homolog